MDERSNKDGACRSRRRLLTGLVGGGALLTAWGHAAAVGERRSLALSHNHTGEWLDTVYFADGAYITEALAKINHLLRDFRNDQQHEIDVRLLDTLSALRTLTGSTAEYQVISAYRSPRTNEMLRKNTTGVARKSLHIEGRAIDVRLSGYDTAELRRAAISLRRGGVGYYPESNFLHVDTGRVRAW